MKDKPAWEYTYDDEHWEIYKTVESFYCIPKTNIKLYVVYTSIKLDAGKYFYKIELSIHDNSS